MATALKDRPNLKFVVPPGLTVASYDSGWGTVTDAFKPGQTPGANTAEDTAAADSNGSDNGSGDNGAPPAPSGGVAAGVDTGLGGLY
jgi:penicillin-binding protein 1A